MSILIVIIVLGCLYRFSLNCAPDVAIAPRVYRGISRLVIAEARLGQLSPQQMEAFLKRFGLRRDEWAKIVERSSEDLNQMAATLPTYEDTLSHIRDEQKRQSEHQRGMR